MADEKKMPVDGSGTEMREPDGNGELASRRDADSGGLPNFGESGGGAYANPHSDKGEEDRFHGGQSTPGYYGKGQLGEKNVDETDNSINKES